MDWNYPDISLDDALKLVKGFVDILVLASGYQPSGRPVFWDVQSMKRALQWSLFFEKLIRNMRSKDEYADSLALLEAELSLLKLDPRFPRGLSHLSVETLSKAKELVVTHLVQALPLRQDHLASLLKAATGVDLDELRASEIDCLDTYLGELLLQSASYKFAVKERGYVKNASASAPENATDRLFKSCCSMDNFAACTIEEVLKRQNAVSLLSTAQTGLDSLSTIVQHSVLENAASSSSRDEQEVKFSTWNNWKSKSLSYLLDKRTIRLVSGAGLIFSVPKCEWVKVFDMLNISKDKINLHETMELLLLGCVADRWNHLLNHLMSLSYTSYTFPKQYSEVQSLLTGRPLILNAVDKNSKEYGIIEYLAQLLDTHSKLRILCKLPPALVAAAIPIWSPLFRSHVGEIERQLKQYHLLNRLCTCTGEMMHTNCEIAERVWCLYSFHVRGSFHADYSRSSTT